MRPLPAICLCPACLLSAPVYPCLPSAGCLFRDHRCQHSCLLRQALHTRTHGIEVCIKVWVHRHRLGDRPWAGQVMGGADHQALCSFGRSMHPVHPELRRNTGMSGQGCPTVACHHPATHSLPHRICILDGHAQCSVSWMAMHNALYRGGHLSRF